MKKITISKNEIDNILKYIISQMKDKRLFAERWKNDINEYTAFLNKFIQNNTHKINEIIHYMVSFRKNKKYEKFAIHQLSHMYHYDLVKIFSDMEMNVGDNYSSKIVGKSLKKKDILLSTIYYLVIEYELSPFERESIKCFGKNFFSGEEYNSPEFRELS